VTFTYADTSSYLGNSPALAVLANGLDYAADGTLFAAFGEGSAGSITFRAFVDTWKDPTTISGSASPNPVPRYSSSTVTGSLLYPLGGTVGVQTLHVKRVNWDKTQTTLPNTITAS